MKIYLKIFILAILFFIITMSTINAASISMNLENLIQDNINSTETEIDDINNNIENNSLIDENNIEETSPKITSSTSSSSGEFLTVENVISIILIVLGILLVLFAIAILIRFK